MLWGGLEAFIVVNSKDTGDQSDTEIVTSSRRGVNYRHFEYVLAVTNIAGVNRRILVNRIGKFALAAGLLVQFIALYIDP
jgi:hypothetical protein